MIGAEKYSKALLRAKDAKDRQFEKRAAGWREAARLRDLRDCVTASNRCGSHEGCFRASHGEGYAHALRKFEVWWALKRKGHVVLCETIFKGGAGRADILDTTDLIIYEIVSSESEESVLLKQSKYPASFEVRAVRCDVPFDEKLLS